MWKIGSNKIKSIATHRNLITELKLPEWEGEDRWGENKMYIVEDYGCLSGGCGMPTYI